MRVARTGQDDDEGDVTVVEPLMHRRTFLVFGLLLGCSKASSSSSEDDRHPRGVPWQRSQVVLARALAEELARPSPDRPRVVHVGPAILFKSAHVPGAEHVSEAGTSDGLAVLERWLGPMDRATRVVLYCGCCPYQSCPNIRPAFAKALALGFTNVRVLDLPTTLKADWTDLGLPVERGS